MHILLLTKQKWEKGGLILLRRVIQPLQSLRGMHVQSYESLLHVTSNIHERNREPTHPVAKTPQGELRLMCPTMQFQSLALSSHSLSLPPTLSLRFYPQPETAWGLETQTASQPWECFLLLSTADACSAWHTVLECQVDSQNLLRLVSNSDAGTNKAGKRSGQDGKPSYLQLPWARKKRKQKNQSDLH